MHSNFAIDFSDTATSPFALGGDALPLPDSLDGTVLLQLPQRPFGASAELPASLVRSLAGECVLARAAPSPLMPRVPFAATAAQP